MVVRSWLLDAISLTVTILFFSTVIFNSNMDYTNLGRSMTQDSVVGLVGFCSG